MSVDVNDGYFFTFDWQIPKLFLGFLVEFKTWIDSPIKFCLTVRNSTPIIPDLLIPSIVHVARNVLTLPSTTNSKIWFELLLSKLKKVIDRDSNDCAAASRFRGSNTLPKRLRRGVPSTGNWRNYTQLTLVVSSITTFRCWLKTAATPKTTSLNYKTFPISFTVIDF